MVNIYDSVNMFARNLIYEGPLHASFINVFAITRAGEPANRIFLLTRVFTSFDVDTRTTSSTTNRRLGQISMHRNRYSPRTNASLVYNSREIDMTRGGKKKKEKGKEGGIRGRKRREYNLHAVMTSDAARQVFGGKADCQKYRSLL